MIGYLALANDRLRRKAAGDLALQFSAAHGDLRGVKAQVSKLSRGED